MRILAYCFVLLLISCKTEKKNEKISDSDKVQTVIEEHTEFKMIYEDCSLVSLPLVYDNKFVSFENPLFKNVPVKVMKSLGIPYGNLFSIAKLPKFNSEVYPVILNEVVLSGRVRFILMTLDKNFKLLDRIEIYSYEEVEQGEVFKVYDIDTAYSITIKSILVANEQEKELKTVSYKISETGNFILLK